MDDRSIVELFLAREERAIELTEAEYGQRLGRIALGITGDERTAEECVNDALFEAWNRIPPSEPYEYLFPFLGRIVRCIAINRAEKERAQKRSAAITELTRELEECLPSGADVQSEAEGRELTRVIEAFLQGLPEEKRNMFIRRYWYFDSVERIAELSGKSSGSVKMLLMRLRKKLAEHLERNGWEI